MPVPLERGRGFQDGPCVMNESFEARLRLVSEVLRKKVAKLLLLARGFSRC